MRQEKGMKRKWRIWRRCLPLFAAGVVLLSVQGCSAKGEEDGSVLAGDHLLTVWSDYLRVQEEMYASEFWAMDYVKKYLETGSWDDLSKARTACIASARLLSDLSMEEEDLTDEEYAVLAEAGMDVSFQSEQLGTIENDLGEAHTFVRNRMLESLEEDIFFSSDVERLKKEIELEKEYCFYLLESECNALNYLLLMVEDNERARDFWEALPDQYPTLASGCLKWSDSESELEKQEEQCLDHMQEILLDKADLEAAMSADLYELEQIMERGGSVDWDEMSFAMSNTPAFLPAPEWYASETARYLSFTEDEEGNVVYPESGDHLTDDFYGVYVEIEGVSESEIDIYLESFNHIMQGVKKTEGKDEWVIMMPDYSVQIHLQDGTATLSFYGRDVTFAPAWYLEE